jgi:ribulose-bisphosphate carboxylase large chain
MEEVIAKYTIKSKLPLEEAAKRIAEEESTGTWTHVSTTTKSIEKKYSARVGAIDRDKGTVEVHYPLADFDLKIGGIPQVLSIVAGNLFGLSSLDGVRLIDVDFPKPFVQQFGGPNFGIDGVRKLIGTTKDKRPHIGTIIKPKIGLSPKQTAEVAYEAAMGGIDFIKDDETLVSQSFCSLEKRVAAVMDKLDEVRSQTKRNVLYACNVTSTDVLETAEKAVKAGANCLMIDVMTCGFGSLQMLAKNFKKYPIHVHRTMHGAVDRSKDFGIDFLVFAKLVRLAGGDQLHIGSVLGKMEGAKDYVVAIEEAIEKPVIKQHAGLLGANWHGMKPVFAVSSGGLHPGMVPELVKLLGKNIVIQAGGGVHGHPFGTRAGAVAMRQSLDAAMKGVPLQKYAKDHVELAKALETWHGL